MKEQSTFDDGTKRVLEILQALQDEIVKKEGDTNKNLQIYINNGNCRLDNLHKLAFSHGIRLIVRHPITKQWHAYGDRTHEIVKQVCFLFVEQNENYTNALVELGLTRRTIDNWCQIDIYPLLKAFLKLTDHLGFELAWIPQTCFCKTCKYRLSFPVLPRLNICWHPKVKDDLISPYNPACEYFVKLKIGE